MAETVNVCPRCGDSHQSGSGRHPTFTQKERFLLLDAGARATREWPPKHGNYFQIQQDGRVVVHPAFQAWFVVFGQPIDAIEAALFFSAEAAKNGWDWASVLDEDPVLASKRLSAIAGEIFADE